MRKHPQKRAEKYLKLLAGKMRNKKIIINCSRCKGTGVLRDGFCIECDGKGYRTMDKQVYYRQLIMEQKARKGLEK